MRNPLRPQPAPPAFGNGKVVPETTASPLSSLFFSWLDPLLYAGFSRPLQKDDLWSLPEHRLTGSLTKAVESAFYKRCIPEERPFFCREQTAPETEREPAREKSPNHDASLLKALHSVFWVPFWTAGVLKLLADSLVTTTPLVTQVLLTWLTTSFVYVRASDEERTVAGLQKPQGIGYGIGLAFAIFCMQAGSSLLTAQYGKLVLTNGLCLRTSVIGAIFRKSLRLSGRARNEHSVGQMTTMISTDATRLEENSLTIHTAWIAPIQIAITLGLLIRNLGVSALVGLAILIFGMPIQGILAAIMFAQRKKGVAITDQRVRMVTEVLSGIRLIKYYAWEAFYEHQVGILRGREIGTIRKLVAARSALIGAVSVVPVLAIVLSIVTYALLGHSLDVAIIFSSVQLFGNILLPFTLLPIVLASATDAVVALGRIGTFLRAEELAVPYAVDASNEFALDVDGDFTWEVVKKEDSSQSAEKKDDAKDEKTTQKKQKASKKASKKGARDDVLPVSVLPADDTTVSEPVDEEKEKRSQGENDESPFELKDLKLQVPKGAFVAIVGRVGSGKSSVLQALIGEMRKTRGDCIFSSTVAYAPQTAWIMNATVRENIIFGQPEDEEKFRAIIKACSLERDLAMLPHGENTEIGEKGINLSGGQKARVSLARAAYSGAEIVLMDDSLSAVDAYVGKKLLENCLLHGPLADKTRILVTHALHVLDKTDYIYVVDEGKIVEQGAYTDLRANGNMFSRLMDEYGSSEKQGAATVQEGDKAEVVPQATEAVPSASKEASQWMQDEERLTGAVSWRVYQRYGQFAGGVLTLPLVVFWIVLVQCAQVANSLFLGFWTASSIPGFTQADYVGTYAALGLANGLFSFAASLTISQVSLIAGLRTFRAAFMAVARSPVAFFDTTPLGRILSRLSKDQDTIDTELALIVMQLLFTISSVFGTIGLVFYVFPYLGIIFIPLIVLYYITALFYRRTSVEVKRLDSLLRSVLYNSYSETLTGLSTVRAYRLQDQFVQKSEHGLDLENRAYYMTVIIQQWLSIRLDLLGNLLVLGICLFAAGFRHTVNPSKIGVVLSYTLSITQLFSTMVSTYALNEQNFNAVERILHYADLPSEGAFTTPDDPPPTWPENGAIEFKDVEMSYREGLPAILKGVSFSVKPGEKIGIVGRTGAGKSSLLQVLFRIVNAQAGKIEIDGRNVADIGLSMLRGRLALVPQDSVLFKGTLRDNLDPFNTRTDAEIIETLKRAWLLPREGPPDSAAEAKFSLDSPVSDEGSNYSAGEKQLLALCRALVKNSRIIVLDEATSNVDVDTDAKVQRTIRTEFASSTLLCIAHRLNTIVYYDRILVMDAGRVAEFDSPLELFDRDDSIFRSLCDEAHLSRADIVKIRATVHGSDSSLSASSVSVAPAS